MALPSNAWRRVHQYAKTSEELNLAPVKRSPSKGAPEQSGVQGLLQGNESHNTEGQVDAIETFAKLCNFVEQYISSPRVNPGFRLTALLKTWSRCTYLVRLQLRPSMHLGRRLSNIPMVHDSPSFLSFSHFPPSNTLYEQNRPALHWLSSSQGDFARPVRSKNNDNKTNNNIA